MITPTGHNQQYHDFSVKMIIYIFFLNVCLLASAEFHGWQQCPASRCRLIYRTGALPGEGTAYVKMVGVCQGHPARHRHRERKIQMPARGGGGIFKVTFWVFSEL